MTHPISDACKAPDKQLCEVSGSEGDPLLFLFVGQCTVTHGLPVQAKSPWDVNYQQEKNPDLIFSATKER